METFSIVNVQPCIAYKIWFFDADDSKVHKIMEGVWVMSQISTQVEVDFKRLLTWVGIENLTQTPAKILSLNNF